jgi:CAAX protease family protein
LAKKQLLICFGFFALVFAYVARVYADRYALAPFSAACIYLSFISLLALVLIPGFFKSLPPKLPGFSHFLVPLWCAPYLIYALGTGNFHGASLLKLLAIALPVWAIYRFLPVQDSHTFNWQDGAVAVLLVLVVLSHRTRGIWNVPVNLDFMMRLFLISVASWCWRYVRPVPGLGYEFRLSIEIARQATLNFAYFAAIAIPLSLALRFTRWNPLWHGVGSFLLNYLEIFLFVALLEETFFRGFLQTLLSNRLHSWVIGQLVVSCLFGLFHILHAPFPNWQYVVLATLAGWFYGSAFRRSGSLMASSLTHAAVDAVWRTWFSAR